MTLYARYTVVFERQLGDLADGGGVYHDGSGAGAVKQLAGELQEAFDCGHIEGQFMVTERRIVNVDPDGTGDLNSLPTEYDDEPEVIRLGYPQIDMDVVLGVLHDLVAVHEDGAEATHDQMLAEAKALLRRAGR